MPLKRRPPSIFAPPAQPGEPSIFAGKGKAGQVTSVFGRIGAVIAMAGDYTADLVSNAVSTLGSYADPSWITSLAWSKITGAPAVGVSSVFTRTGSVVAASGDYTAAQITNAVDTTQSYLNPGWIASLAYSKITGAPAAGMADPTTTKGDIIARGTAAPATRLGVGTDGQVLTADAASALGIKWATSAAGGISGSTGPSDGRIVRASGTGGATIQPSGVAIGNDNNIYMPNGTGIYEQNSVGTVINLFLLDPSDNLTFGGGSIAKLYFVATAGADIGFQQGSTVPFLIHNNNRISFGGATENNFYTVLVQDTIHGQTNVWLREGPSQSGDVLEVQNASSVKKFGVSAAGALSLPAYTSAANNFANDAAAATGGIPIGGIYHNAGVLRVRLT